MQSLWEILTHLDGKAFFFDSETGFYYANGSYYDPETGLYVDASPISTVFENADFPKYIDRNGVLSYNTLALAGSPYNVFTTVELAEDPNYDPGKTWWERIPNWLKFTIGGVLTVAAIALAFAPGGQAGAVFLKTALVQLAIGVGATAVGWAISSAISGNWNTNALVDSLADAIFFTGISLFIQSSVSVIKYAYRVGQISEYSPEFIEWLNKGEANNSVYKAVTSQGDLIYTGITKQPIKRRLYQHQLSGKPFDELKVIHQGLTRNQARAIETYRILTDGTSQINQILSISKQHRFFDEAMKWAKIFLGG